MLNRILCGVVCCLLLCGWGAPVVYGAVLTDNGNGTVTDSSTGLVWQQGEGGSQTWDNALTYCESLSLAGADDWRLPNIKELESLSDDTRYYPALDTTYFPNAYSSYYWSSTTFASNTGYAWGVSFDDGGVNYDGKGTNYYVRCVRGGQSGSLGSLGISPTSAVVNKPQNYTITGSNLPATIVGNIEGSPDHCTYVSGSGDSIVLSCNAPVAGHRRFYLALTAGGSTLPGSEELYVDVADTRTAGDPGQSGSRAINGVDVATGNLYLPSVDLAVPGKGVTFNLSRTYNSLAAGWSFGYGQTLQVSAANNRIITITREDGRKDSYYKDDDNLWYASTPGNFDQLQAQGDGSYKLYTKGSTIYNFGIPNSGGLATLASINDRDGNILTITTLSATQKRVTDSAGRNYTLDYDAGGRLIKATDFSSRYVQYTWDANGNLVSFRDLLGNSTTYGYNNDTGVYRLATIRDPRGVAGQYNSMAVTYVTLASALSEGSYHEGKVETVTDAEGRVTTYRYGTENTGCPADAPLLTGVVRPKTNSNTVNNTLAYCYDLLGRVAVELNAANYGDYKTSRAFKTATSGKTSAEQGLVNKVISPRFSDDPETQYFTAFDYSGDGRGNKTSSTNPLKQKTDYSHKTETDYPGALPNLNVMSSFTTPLLNSYSFTHKTSGNIETIKTPIAENPATEFTYLSNGLMETVKDPGQNTTRFEYNTDGTVKKTIDAKLKAASYTYDSLGRVETATDRRNVVTKYTYYADGSVHTTTSAYGTPRAATVTNTYDVNGNLATIKDARNNIRTYTYTKDNRLATESFTAGGTTYTRTNIYDELGRLWKVTNENNHTSQSDFDAGGRKTSETDAQPATTVYTYDKNGNVLTKTDPLGHATTYTYDELDRVKTVKDHLNNTVTYSYDAEGNLEIVEDPKKQQTRYQYYADGKLKTVTDPNNGVTSATYDAAGNLKTVSGPKSGNLVTYNYDELNRMISMVDASNSRTWSFTYDENGNLLTQVVPGLGTTQYQYDELSRVTRIAYPDSSTVQYEYDLNGNRTKMIDSVGTTSYVYDEANRLTSVTDPFNKTVAYTYDGVGNVKRITYPGTKNLEYGYDAAERLATVTNWLNHTTTYSYNKIHQLTQIANANGTKATFGYDIANRLISLQNLKSSNAVISSHSSTLDANGNLLQSTVTLPLQPKFNTANTSLAFDVANRIITSGSTSFTHDLAGRIVAETTAGATKNYTYNHLDLLTSITGADTYSYIYNGDGNRLAMSKNGVQTRYVLDLNQSLPEVLAETNSAGTVTAYYTYGNGLISKIDAASGQEQWYHFDPTGNTLALTDSNQNITDSYAYTPYGEATVQGTTWNPFKYSGRHGVMDDGNGLNYMRARYYKPGIGRFMSLDAVWGDMDKPQSLNRFAYVQGDPLVKIDPSGKKLTEEQWDKVKDTVVSAGVTVLSNSGKVLFKAIGNGYGNFQTMNDYAELTLKFASMQFKVNKKRFESLNALLLLMLEQGAGSPGSIFEAVQLAVGGQYGAMTDNMTYQLEQYAYTILKNKLDSSTLARMSKCMLSRSVTKEGWGLNDNNVITYWTRGIQYDYFRNSNCSYN